jgi:hypothetical protein
VVIDKCLEAEEIPADTVISRAEEEDKKKSFGPWMLVSRRKRQTKLAVPAVPRDTPGVSAAKDHVNSAQQLAGSSAAKGNDNTAPAAVKRNYNSAQKHAAPSDVSSFENTAQRDFDKSVMILQDAGQSGVRSVDKTIQHAYGANRRVAGSIDRQRRVKANQQFRYSHYLVKFMA